MNNFLLNVIAGVIASLIFCLICKVFLKVKSTQLVARVKVAGNLILKSSSISSNRFI
ncbi:hypothetical protein MT357_04210 [Clostridioides difficile]|uniref:hypothetical protein n=1 Tax=Clostridioides difficile TaxID=1496 RepID=UPI0024B17C67|nr:hypothetical protein [Clostridioides difficile]MDI9211853.1 hypothetical protein [Clostridioides difficile]